MDVYQATIKPTARSLLYFTASKYVLIKDWRLGATLRTLQVGILTYVLVDIFLKASYLTMEVPTGHITAWPANMDLNSKLQTYKKQGEAYRNRSLAYCTDPAEYAFTWDLMEHSGYECAYLDPAAVFINGESQLFVTTSLRITKTDFYTRDSNNQCKEGKELGLDGAPQLEPFPDICCYGEEKGFFPINPENISVDITHSYRTSSFVNKKGRQPRTIIRPRIPGDEPIIYKANQPLRVNLAALLKVAGIDLDKRLDEQENQPTRDTTQGAENKQGKTIYPYARLSGLTLQVTMNYYTRKLAPEDMRKHVGPYSNDEVCIVDIVPENKWTFAGSDIRPGTADHEDHLLLTPKLMNTTSPSGDPILLTSQIDTQRNGVEIVFLVSGNVGRFEMNSLISALVAGSVLLAIAQIITTYIAIYALGLSSELYKAFMKETVDWRKEYARYAAQMCIAGYVFTKYDVNNSKELDRKEIFDILKNLMSNSKDVKEWHLAALVDFLMRQGDKSVGIIEGQSKDGEKTPELSIDIEEWVDIFTENKVSWPSLIKLIENEYKDEAAKNNVITRLRTVENLSFFEQLANIEEGDERDGTSVGTADRNDVDGTAVPSHPLLNRSARRSRRTHSSF